MEGYKQAIILPVYSFFQNMIWFPPAKINLGLQVLKKRTDGFHDICTFFYPVPWTDILEIIPADKFEFSSSGLSIPGDIKKNLCVKAYNLLKTDYDLPPVKIHLHKIIPMGAGLGGGSSDAAYTLLGLNEIFELEIAPEKLHNYAAQLGSDCAFFLYKIPMLAFGRGEKLQHLDFSLDGLKIIIVYPNIHVETGKAFGKLTPNNNREALEKILQEKESWKDTLRNDFETSIFEEYPVIKNIKKDLYNLGAEYASMSGSGSSVFGLFRTVPDNIEGHFADYTVFISD